MLSIITVCFNSEKTIRETFDSVLKQGYTDYEYIVVDGASKDGTVAVCREYEPLFEGRMRWISEPDKGIYDAMNKGIAMAMGEYIGLINSDDYYLEGAFETVALLAESSSEKPDVIYSDMDRVDENGEVVQTVIGDVKKLWKGMFVNHPTCFVRREAYENFGTFDTGYRIVADYELMLRIRHGGGTFAKAGRKLACLRTGGVSYRNFSGEKEKFRAQRKYFSLPVCCYVYLRSVYACLIRPFLYRIFGIAKKN